MLRKLFSRSTIQEQRPKFVIIVSGLPRSGTSMMMKMLAEGGIPIITDEIRNADEDNPNGYYEFEPVKELINHQNKWLTGSNGKAIKIISTLLEYLPADQHYKVIFMERDINEVLASQQKMLARRNEEAGINDEAMRQQFEQHLKVIKYWLGRQPNIDVLYIEYNRMVVNAEAYCAQINEFLGLSLDVVKMCAVPNERLYRNRAEKES